MKPIQAVAVCTMTITGAGRLPEAGRIREAKLSALSCQLHLFRRRRRRAECSTIPITAEGGTSDRAGDKLRVLTSVSSAWSRPADTLIGDSYRPRRKPPRIRPFEFSAPVNAQLQMRAFVGRYRAIELAEYRCRERRAQGEGHHFRHRRSYRSRRPNSRNCRTRRSSAGGRVAWAKVIWE